MGGLSIWHWIIFIAAIAVPVIIAVRARSFVRAILWCWVVAVGLGLIIVGVAMAAGSAVDLPEFATRVVYTAVMLSVIAGVGYGAKWRFARSRSAMQSQQLN